jgi:hypothetical protein
MTDFLDPYVNELVAVLAAILAGLVMKILTQLMTRFNFAISADQQAQLEHFIAQQIAAMAETQAAIAKNKIAGTVLTATQKLEAVVAATLTKFPRVSEEEARQITQATLIKLGEGAQVAVSGLGGALRTAQ